MSVEKNISGDAHVKWAQLSSYLGEKSGQRLTGLNFRYVMQFAFAMRVQPVPRQG